jgi:predicted Zn-dependent protease
MDVAEAVLDLVGSRGEAQVTVGRGPSALTRFANSFIHQNVGEEVFSVSLKVAVGQRVASGSTSRTDRDGLERLVAATLASAAASPEDPHWPGLAPPEPVSTVGHHDPATEEAGPQERAEQVAAFVAAGPGLRAAGYCETVGMENVAATSAGQRASGRWTRATLDGIHQTRDSAGSAHQSATALADLDGHAAGLAAADRAGRSQAPVDVEPGEYEVVLEPECVATMLIFLGAYGFNAKGVLEGQSGIEPGTDQFDPAVTIWDDGTDPRALGVPFDVDGTPSRRVELVTAGRSCGLVHDRRTAARMGTTSTGHAHPASDAWGPFPSSVFMAPGTAPQADLIASVRRGLLVTTFNYCRVLDPKSQVTTGLTRNGTFLIEDGEVRGGVANLRFTQSFIEALAPGNVLGVGADARFADSELGPGMIHCPSLHLAAFRFTGGARG